MSHDYARAPLLQASIPTRVLNYNLSAYRNLGLSYGFAALRRLQAIGVSLSRELNELSLAEQIAGPSAPDYARATSDYQRAAGLHPDGELGGVTWGKVCDRVIHHVREPNGAFEVAGVVVPVQSRRVRVVARHGLFTGLRRRTAPLQRAVGHWGGLNERHCIETLQTRRLSTHLVCSHALDAGVLSVTQAADFAVVTAHVGNFNNTSIGIDIARSPRAALASHYGATAKDLLPNSTGRGEKQYLPLPDGYAAAFADLVREVAALFALDITQPYPGHGVLPPKQLEGRGFVGHHHLSPTKWDIAPWAEDIFSELVKGASR